MNVINRVTVYLAMALICVLASGRVLAVDLVQAPLFIEGNVPGNLALVPSVEYPTVISVANLGDYDPDKAYTGYFDSKKCYKYSYDYHEQERHFRPSSSAPNHTCSGSGEWSGNFLSWAATQTIDPFRLVLTGGHRVKDTPTETWLEKARHNRNELYPDRRIEGRNTVRGATPFDSERLTVRIADQETEMVFRTDSDWRDLWYDDCNYGSYNDGCSARRASVRVKVCDASVGLESFCKEYDQGWKPEGLLQQYAEDVKVSIFGYLNDDDGSRDGGVLRAKMKYVGPRKMTDNGWVVNEHREWDPDTGVLIQNPDKIDRALNVSIDDSGVINYLNKFGQLNKNSFKSIDPVSELYYTAYRYFSNLGPVPAYTAIPKGTTSATRSKWVDNFPVITDWDDPIEYSCQKNVILGIGDANTHRDKNLPGSTPGNAEPNKPSEVSQDNSVNVVTETNRVGQLEGLGNIGNSSSFSGRDNSAYIAGLAYRAHTRDIRPGEDDIPGIQTISTYWVDVLENQVLEDIGSNQYYLAAKYGGFNFSDSFDPENPDASLIKREDWSTNGEKIYPGDQNNIGGGRKSIDRPDNYYLAGKAESMVSSLGKAFHSFVEHIRSSSSSVAANSTRLDTDSLIYQAIFNSNTWYGDLIAYGVDENGNIDATATWNAGQKLDAISNARLVSDNAGSQESPSRRIFTMNPTTGQRIPFLWASLTDTQRAALSADDNLGDDRVDYLRGDTRLERRNGGLFRNRLSRLGDIINSNPAYSGREGFGYQLLPNTAGEKYTSYLDDKRARRAMIYVGANDGMLHGFDAETGREMFAYIPASIVGDLVHLTDPEYSHRYYVDGSPIVTDVYLGGEWKTVLIGTFGAGGKGLFALDISTPDNPQVLWEFSDPELGEGVREVSVIPVDDDASEWVVAVGNGYNSVSRRAALILIDMETGEKESLIQVGPEPSADEAGNGLAGITAISSSQGYIADTIYGGDLEGNLWKFHRQGNTWKAAFGSDLNPKPLFIAKNADGEEQPITARPEVTLTDDGRILVTFGTGKYLELADIHDQSVQSAYGIIDEDNEITRNDLVGQSIAAQGTSTIDGESVPWREVTDNPLGSASGWYLDLVPPGGSKKGERIIVRPVIRGEAVVLSTLIPSATPCGGGGSSWIMAISKNNGGVIDGGVFDINDDGVIDENDYVNDGTVPAAGIGSSNIVSRLNFMAGPGGVDRGYGTDTGGGIVDVPFKSFGAGPGRQAWRQLR